jgi:hypothetical protein
MVIYDISIYKPLLFERVFDWEGRPYPIVDDDLDEVLSKSEFAPIGKRRSV